LLLLLFLSACAPARSTGLPEVVDARIRELLPGQDKTVGYFDITNPTAEPLVLVRAEADFARAIEFHTTFVDGDIMRMRRLPEVELPPGERVRFQPGGRHLMLFGVTSPGEENEVRLHLEDGRVIRARFRQVAVTAP
jgi:copper(I)-binding protein